MAFARIPESTLEDILSRLDIVELISSYIPLKRAGRNYRASCPFHHEKTPSFMVSPQRQIYHCFGCGAGGNAFNFLMQYERLEFPEAVEILARKAGVALPEVQQQDEKSASLSTQLYKINEIAALYYQSLLNSTSGFSAKLYLEKRDIKEDTIKLFKLGYAPDRWDMLMNHLRAQGFSLNLIEKAGLILPKEGGGYYDRFRNRLIFPILDVKSRILGFGARVWDNTLPKYINSPETTIYTKGKHLYGLALSKEAVRESDSVVVVEGYLDFIMPYQQGLQNIVASLGTALTPEQARLLKRYTHNVIILYDADKAGEMATLRNLDIFIEEGLSVRVVSLPVGFDPDLFVRRQGVNSLKERIGQSEDLFDYKLRILRSRYNSKDVEGKVKISTEILSTINKFKNAVSKSEYIKKLSEALGVAEDALLQELKKAKSDKPFLATGQVSDKRPMAINPTERLLIKLMLESSGVVQRIRDELEPADFQDDLATRIVSVMFELAAQGRSVQPSALINHLEGNDTLRLICESTFMPEVSEEDKDKVVDDCIQRLKRERIKQRKQCLHEQIKHAQRLGDEKEINRLLEEFHHLVKQG